VADVVDKKTRSRMMAGIRGKNTKPELILRRALHKNGFRYRIHDSRLPGKPDIVLPMYKALIFVHGCFWHRHMDCWWNTSPSSNTAFWKDKLARNAERDARHMEELRSQGWRIAIVWECSFRLSNAEQVAIEVKNWLKSQEPALNLPITTRRRVPSVPISPIG
jgi:DNA mismatch endonuclease (patch repair protein)